MTLLPSQAELWGKRGDQTHMGLSLFLPLSLIVCICKMGLVVAVFVKSSPTLCNPVHCSLPASLSMGFSRQEYCGGLPFPLPRELPDSGIEPASSAWQADSLPLTHLRSQWGWGKLKPDPSPKGLRFLQFSSHSCRAACFQSHQSPGQEAPGPVLANCHLRFQGHRPE